MTLLKKIWQLYYDGFRNMTIGRTLWLIILIKLIIIFLVLRLFLFPRSEAVFMYKTGSDFEKKECPITKCKE